MGSTGRFGNARCLAHPRHPARVGRQQVGTAGHLHLLCNFHHTPMRAELQTAPVQATIAMEREQAPAKPGKEAPVPNPLDFEITVPDMSKVPCTSCTSPNTTMHVLSFATLRLVPPAASIRQLCLRFKLQPHVHMQTVLGIILGGGAGSRLYPLTKKRAKPAVPLGANYRLIDIPVSNCINSNVNKIYCLTQFNSASLNRHLSQAYVSSCTAFACAGTCILLPVYHCLLTTTRVAGLCTLFAVTWRSACSIGQQHDVNFQS